MSAEELMLTKGLKSCVWTPKERQSEQFTTGGAGKVIEYGGPFWEVDFTYENLREIDWRKLTAWAARRRGAAVTFKAFPAMQRSPLNGDPGSVSISEVGSDELRVNTNPTLSLGDFLAYNASGSGRFVGQVVEITGGGSGYINCRTFPPRVGVSGSAAVVDAAGIFRMVPTSLRMTNPLDPKKRLSFTARQVEPT